MKKTPFHYIAHPFDAFWDLRFKNEPFSPLYVGLILVVWFLVLIMDRQNTGFLFNRNNAGDLNIILILTKSVGLYALWVAGNWVVTSFGSGIGRLSDIMTVSAYALLPYIGALAINIALSNILVLPESGYLGYISFAGTLWSAAILLIGLRQVHDIELLQTLFHMIMTVLCMAVAVFLLVLFYTLARQLMMFFYTLYKEIIFRL